MHDGLSLESYTIPQTRTYWHACMHRQTGRHTQLQYTQNIHCRQAHCPSSESVHTLLHVDKCNSTCTPNTTTSKYSQTCLRRPLKGREKVVAVARWSSYPGSVGHVTISTCDTSFSSVHHSAHTYATLARLM